MSTEQSVRDAWANFCKEAKALQGHTIRPGRTLDDQVSISTNGDYVKPKAEKIAAPKPVKNPFFAEKKDD